MSLQLTNPNEYKGGDLILHLGNEPTILSKEQGKLYAFPSYTLHEVTPVTKGTRYSLVAWITGPHFK
jgi:PKHD-type hydroxylase